jgi:RAQPRD family integrative conjugative element protein
MGLLCLVWLISLTTQASDYVSEAERQALAQLVSEMQKLERLIDQAEHNRASHSRFPLNYKALREDWRSVQMAISRHLDKPSRVPRKLPPLNADYTH